MKLYLLVGQSNSGKDTIAVHLRTALGIVPVVSYTTRPMRKYERDGIQHKFISKNKMAQLRQNSQVIAYSKSDKTGNEYGLPIEELPKESCVFIVNPDGVVWFRDHQIEGYDTVVIYVKCSEDVLRERALEHGDDLVDFETRLEHNRASFQLFDQNGDFDYCIDTSLLTKEGMYNEIERIVAEVEHLK